LWLLFPIVLYVVRPPRVYDGIRHFLFVLPAMAIVAAAGGASLRIARRPALVMILIVVSLVPAATAMMRIHPYQYAYYNELAGGLGGASGRYETDYWMTSYREAMLWVNDHRCSGTTRVLVAANEYSAVTAAGYAAPGVEVTSTMRRSQEPQLPERFDYFIATVRFRMAMNYPETPIAAAIGRDGATFTVVRGGCNR
ncbi:MAG TPA: hypothetical protein VFT12_13990, partial [Thermoanaerobaculia bacterium]|nr:hypothetical protein [Thermoanaerobaculia bacterium]